MPRFRISMPFLATRKQRVSSPINPSGIENLSSPVSSQAASGSPQAPVPKAKESQRRASCSTPSFQRVQNKADDPLTTSSDEICPVNNQDNNSETRNSNAHDQQRHENPRKLEDRIVLKRKRGIKEQALMRDENSGLSVNVSNALSTHSEGKCTSKYNLDSRQIIDEAKPKSTFLQRMRQYMQFLFSSFLTIIVLHTNKVYNGVRNIVTEVWKLAKEEAMECAYSIPAISNILTNLAEDRPGTTAYSWFSGGSEMANPKTTYKRSHTWNPEGPSSWGYNDSKDVRNFRRHNLTLSYDSEWSPQDSDERAWVLSGERADESSDEDKIEMVFPAEESGCSSETQQKPASETRRACNTIRLSQVEPMEVGEVEKMSSVVGNYVREINDLREPGDISEEEVKSPAIEEDHVNSVFLSAKPVSPGPKHAVFAQDTIIPEAREINEHEVPSEKRVSMALKSVQIVREKVVRTGASVRNAARSLARPLQRYNRGQSESQFFNQETAGTTTTRLARLLTHTYGCDVVATRRRKHVWKIRCDRAYTNGTVLRVKLVVQPVDAHSCTISIYPARNSSGSRDGSPEYLAFVASLKETFFAG